MPIRKRAFGVWPFLLGFGLALASPSRLSFVDLGHEHRYA
jgi:hypothetical protein